MKDAFKVTVEASAQDVSGWSDTAPIAFHLARTWARYGIRGKGWLARTMGRTLCRDMKCTVQSEHGAKIACFPGSLDTYAGIWAAGGRYEPQVVAACARLLRVGDVFFDIGANVGLISLDVMAQFNGSIAIEAFEAQPMLARHIAISAALNHYRNLNVHNILVGDETGQRQLFLHAHSIHASIVPRSKNVRPLMCQQDTLDEFVRREKLSPPNVIKMDVEGAEALVLRGAQETIAVHTPCVIFESDENMARFIYTRADIFDQLRSFGDFQFFRISDDMSEWIHVREDRDPNSVPDGNFVAIPDRYRDRLGITR